MAYIMRYVIGGNFDLKVLDKYYAIRGESRNGIPSHEKRAERGLGAQSGC